MSLRSFVDDCESPDATLTVHNPDSESPLYRLLAGLFEEQAVTVRQRQGERAVPADTVVVERGDDPVAVSPLQAVQDTVLLVNSDLYTTGTRGLDDVITPDVLTQLDEIPFEATGTGRSSKSKLLLIELSRYVEARAWNGDGTLHAGFQQLSRLDDERGTRRVYERLGDDPTVEPHVYGVPDSRPSVPGVAVHGDRSAELRRSWFVVYDPPDRREDAAALVVYRTDAGTWEGFWSYDAETVRAVSDYLAETYH